jgi:hypothetical protein
MSCNILRFNALLLVFSLLLTPLFGGEPPKNSPPAGKAKTYIGPKQRGGEKAILKALKQETSVDFAAVPLNEVIDYISLKHHIPVYIDDAGLKDAKVDAKVPVTCRLSGISLRSALEIVLDKLELKWTIHHEVLMITSPARAESDDLMYTKIYDVTDLVVPIPANANCTNPLTVPDNVVSDPTAATTGQPMFAPSVAFTGLPPWPMPTTYTHHGSVGRMDLAFASQSSDFQPLMDTITTTLSQKSWIENGGSGTISNLPPGNLVVNQSREAHQQIEQLIAKLRARNRAIPAFRIELQWLWLDVAHRDLLFGNCADRVSRRDGETIDPVRLAGLTHAVPSFHAQVTCMNAEATRVIAGDRRATIVNAVPGVNGASGYAPIVTLPNVGIAAGVRAVLQPDGTAMLTAASLITRWIPERQPVMIGSTWPAGKNVNVDISQPAAIAPITSKTSSSATVVSAPNQTPIAAAHTSISSHSGGSSSCPVDLPVIPTQEFGTTLRVPLGRPVVIGSVTFASKGNADVEVAKENPFEVYLIATTVVIKRAK